MSTNLYRWKNAQKSSQKNSALHGCTVLLSRRAALAKTRDHTLLFSSGARICVSHIEHRLHISFQLIRECFVVGHFSSTRRHAALRERRSVVQRGFACLSCSVGERSCLGKKTVVFCFCGKISGSTIVSFHRLAAVLLVVSSPL